MQSTQKSKEVVILWTLSRKYFLHWTNIDDASMMDKCQLFDKFFEPVEIISLYRPYWTLNTKLQWFVKMTKFFLRFTKNRTERCEVATWTVLLLNFLEAHISKTYLSVSSSFKYTDWLKQTVSHIYIIVDWTETTIFLLKSTTNRKYTCRLVLLFRTQSKEALRSVEKKHEWSKACVYIFFLANSLMFVIRSEACKTTNRMYRSQFSGSNVCFFHIKWWVIYWSSLFFTMCRKIRLMYVSKINCYINKFKSIQIKKIG